MNVCRPFLPFFPDNFFPPQMKSVFRNETTRQKRHFWYFSSGNEAVFSLSFQITFKLSYEFIFDYISVVLDFFFSFFFIRLFFEVGNDLLRCFANVDQTAIKSIDRNDDYNKLLFRSATSATTRKHDSVCEFCGLLERSPETASCCKSAKHFCYRHIQFQLHIRSKCKKER